MAKAIDPVCRMQVNSGRTAYTSTYMGETYYFCARGCKAAFDSDPKKYTAEEAPHGSHGRACHCH